jgi:hypothetical protein
MKNKPFPDDEEISPDSIDPDRTRCGRSWREVRDSVLKDFKDYPDDEIKRHLKREAAWFVKELSPIERLSLQAVRDDLKETRPELRARVLENWKKDWM